MSWMIIAILIILAFAFLRLRHMKHKLFLILFILVLLFFYTTGSRVLAEHEINWKSVAGWEKGLKTYFAWLGGFVGNLRTITANAVRMDWEHRNRTDEAIRLVEEKEAEK